MQINDSGAAVTFTDRRELVWFSRWFSLVICIAFWAAMRSHLAGLFAAPFRNSTETLVGISSVLLPAVFVLASFALPQVTTTIDRVRKVVVVEQRRLFCATRVVEPFSLSDIEDVQLSRSSDDDGFYVSIVLRSGERIDVSKFIQSSNAAKTVASKIIELRDGTQLPA